MTKRLYYTDAYATHFKANIVERLRYNTKIAVILDETCFYPKSGGQPEDYGTIADTKVVDLVIREEDNAIIHVMADEIWSNESVKGVIDWERRFDHMQQHTGQHILSQAFLQVGNIPTTSFHLGKETSTIDLPQEGLKGSHIEQAEMLANQIIWENRKIRAFSVSKEQAHKLPLLKLPKVKGNSLRIIEIEKFDLNACGGTHVKSTGEVGLIKITSLERQKAHLRVTFCCGQRALLDYRHKNSIINKLTSELTTGSQDLDKSINKMKMELQLTRKMLTNMQQQLIDTEVDALLSGRNSATDVYVIAKVYDNRSPNELRVLAKHLIEKPNIVVLFGIAGKHSRLIFTRSSNTSGQMDKLLKPALQVLGSTAAGGGREDLAQGGGPTATRERVESAVQRAKNLWYKYNNI